MKKIIVLLAFALFSTFAWSEDLRLISAAATGEIEATPDIAIISGRIVEESLEAEDAVAMAQKKLDALIRYLRQQRVDSDDINAAQVLVAPKWHYPRNQARQLTGYEASAAFTVKLRKVSLLAGLYGGLIEAGASELQPTQFDFSNRDTLELEAITAAVIRARAKAEAALAPLGNSVADIQSININTQWQPGPVFRQERATMMSAAADAGPAEINIGKHTISATVNTSFLIK